MPLVVGDLEPRKLEQWRAEIAEALAAHLAYPPYFDHRAGKEIVRPVDRLKREEIEQFVRSMNFTLVEQTDVDSSEVRRFLEQLLRRYLDVNPDLHRPQTMRRISNLRSRVPRVAAEIHKALQAFLAGTSRDFGLRRPTRTWGGADSRAQFPSDMLDHNTRVLEAVLLQRGNEPAAPPSSARPPAPPPQSAPPPQRPHPAQQPAVAAPVRANGAGPLGRWLPGSSPATSPQSPQPPMPPMPGPGSGSLSNASPFASFGTGAQSAIFGASALTERPTGAMPAQGRGAPPGAPAGGPPPPPQIPEEIFQLYGDYLHDMQPEAYGRGGAPAQGGPSPALGRAFADDGMPTSVMAAPQAAQRAPQSGASPRPAAAPSPADGRGDLLIFFQLRYQLEAYIRRAARSYGIQSRSDDPSGVIDALRRSGFVDESDLQLAEGILAVTDRVTTNGTATVDDYRQAFMLYLLYHRSHLGS